MTAATHNRDFPTHDTEVVMRPRPPLYVAAITHNAETGNVEQVKIINHAEDGDRRWLGKHTYWAFRNGKAVTTVPVESFDAEVPGWATDIVD